MTSSSSDSCIVCAASGLQRMDAFSELPRITSDCRTFPKGGKLAVCNACGTVQKFCDSQWFEEIRSIYAQYATYYQGDGDEQIVFDGRTGKVRRRSDVIVERLTAEFALPRAGKALDIGCGGGVTLRTVSNVLPGWTLYGQDLDQRNAERLAHIPGFQHLFVSTPIDIPGQFDLITLIHSIEHFPDPGAVLRALVDKLTPGGLLLVQVCNTERNSYDLLIADHLTHFAPATLELIAARNGYSVLTVETEWVAKELSMVARRSDGTAGGTRPDPQYAARVQPRVRSQLAWLGALAEDASRRSVEGRFGLFGTSICATWLAASLGDKVEFFVDEDPSRQGKTFMDRPVFSPQQVPAGSNVYLALVPEVAALVASRLAALPIQLVQPPGTSA